MPNDDRIVPTTPKGEEPAKAAPPRRRLRAVLATLAVVVAIALVIGIGFAVNGLPGTDDQQPTAQEQAVEQAAESGEGASAQDSAATQEGQPGETSQTEQGQTQSAASPDNPASTDSTETPANAIRVHVTVTADPGAAAKLSWYPQADMDVTLSDDQTPYGALVATGFAIGGSRTYVSSIGGLAEKALGGTSGWMYLVNGSQPMKPAGSYQLHDGDSVYWHYVDSW